MHIYYKVYCVAALLCLASLLPVSAQQFTMKGGISNGSVTVPPRDAADKSGRMTNYYWEFNYGHRLGRHEFFTVGLAYLGAGCTFHYTYQPTGIVAPYNVETRFNNVLIPLKFKISTEHRAHPRIYGFVGVAPGIMFDEYRDMIMEEDKVFSYDKKRDEYYPIPQEELELMKKRNNIPHWTPNNLQNYLLAGGGVYYKHVVLDIALYVSTCKDYKEFMAPVSFNYGAIICIGYQVSRDTKKRW